MFGKNAIRMFSMLSLFSVLVSCSGNKSLTTDKDNLPPVKAVNNEPITLTFYAKLAITDEDFTNFIEKPLKARFPHVTLNHIKNGKGMNPSDLVVAGVTPDIIWEGLTNIVSLTDLDWPANMDPLVQTHKFDLNRIDPTVVSYIRSFSEKGELLYLPFRRYPFVLHWNKGIFDKFGVPYPKNGMTWDETAELARRVSRNDGGIDYRGLSAGVSINRMQTQLSLNFIEPKTGKSVLLTNDLWQDLFRMYNKIFTIPGNYPQGAKIDDGVSAFINQQKLAMFPHLVLLGDGSFIKAVNEGLEWGISTFPVWSGRPGIGPGVISDGFVIPKNSKNTDLAFQLIAYLLSDEVQTMAAKQGNPTALINPEVKKHMYEDNPIVKGKDLSPIFALRSADPYLTTPYDTKANGNIVKKKLELYFTGQMDLNTALRESDEEINKMVETEKAMKQ